MYYVLVVKDLKNNTWRNWCGLDVTTDRQQAEDFINPLNTTFEEEKAFIIEIDEGEL